MWAWKDGSEVKNTRCSFERSRFSSNTHIAAHSILDLQCLWIGTIATHTHTVWQITYRTKISDSSFKNENQMCQLLSQWSIWPNTSAHTSCVKAWEKYTVIILKYQCYLSDWDEEYKKNIIVLVSNCSKTIKFQQTVNSQSKKLLSPKAQ